MFQVERYIIALIELGIKNETVINIIKNCSSADIAGLFEGITPSVFLNIMDLLVCIEYFKQKEEVSEALKNADDILEKNKEHNIKTAIFSQINYPANLYNTTNPPAVLYYKGADPSNDFDKAFACVGTRKPTSFAFNAINYLVPQWVNEGITIISGLASGVDRLSHIACLEAGGKTIAVLAQGLDKPVYPKENRNLAERILNEGGILISQYPVGTRAEKYRFIDRNRILVGLAKATIVFECEVKSGSMHSADFSKELGIPVFTPDPGISTSTDQSGNRYLLENNLASSIPDGTRFEVPIIKTGYEVVCSKMSNNTIKNMYLKSLLYNSEDLNILKKTFSTLNQDSTQTTLSYAFLGEYISDGILKINDVIKILVDALSQRDLE